MNASLRILAHQVFRYRRFLAASVMAGFVAASFGVMTADGKAPQPRKSKASLKQGAELFAKEWLPNDPRSKGGDGLGPVFNDSSCIACHNQGGAGGGGPLTKNVDIISASSRFGAIRRVTQPSVSDRFIRSVFGLKTPLPESADAKAANDMIAQQQKQERKRLSKIHPGFLTSKSVVLHRFGTDPAYAPWRMKMLGNTQNRTFRAAVAVEQLVQQQENFSRLRAFEKIQQANRAIKQVRAELGDAEFTRTSFQQGVTITATQRNPIALFGGGLIDAIPDSVIEEVAKKKHKEFPEIKGRVCRLKDGRIGRFGWKGQKASLYDFAMTACAVELGLHVPDHPQAGVPLNASYKPTGLDMNQAECDSLVLYLKRLPAPARHVPSDHKEAEFLRSGEKLFTSTGCAACHVSELGNVKGIYSDLLLHDIGEEMVDTGEYGVFTPSSPGEEDIEEIELPLAKTEDGKKAKKQIVGAKRAEWRTPPLWGLRDSAPYLHDGRAQTLRQAIAFHGGESRDSAIRFFSLTPKEQQQVVAFLKSLTAPTSDRFVGTKSSRLLSQSSR